ncbi:MAG: hypothetical protein K5790_10535 [Nitrosopumilus sp.]|uniref:hypothetical protein n=1 Tax=Nitrosopumilus sp. TaxID=2024843 RepID=UPI00247EFF2E|nr:hypothetical protein [Nitrosopumilus sp.]MCV0393707.1 hypothetical protein [Nitrosopumilus sp.]
MTIGHTENGVFHPHSQGSGIFSSQITERDSGVDVRPSSKVNLDIRSSINKHKEKFQERKKIKNLPKSEPSQEMRKVTEQRIAGDNLNKVFSLNLSPRFKIAKLKEFKSKQGDMLSDSDKKKLDTFIDNLQESQKAIDKQEQESKEERRKDGTDVLFPSGSANENRQGEKELDKFDEQKERANETQKILDKENKEAEKNNEKLRMQFEALNKKQQEADEQKRKIESSNIPTPQKTIMLKKVKETKSEIDMKKKRALSKVHGQGEKQVLLSAGIVS